MDSEFAWRSKIPNAIYVGRASMFDFDPAPGVLLGPKGQAGLVLPPQSSPPETTITWWHGVWSDKETAEIHEVKVKIPARPESEGRFVLAFTFHEDESWDAHWEQKDH